MEKSGRDIKTEATRAPEMRPVLTLASTLPQAVPVSMCSSLDDPWHDRWQPFGSSIGRFCWTFMAAAVGRQRPGKSTLPRIQNCCAQTFTGIIIHLDVEPATLPISYNGLVFFDRSQPWHVLTCYCLIYKLLEKSKPVHSDCRCAG